MLKINRFSHHVRNNIYHSCLYISKGYKMKTNTCCRTKRPCSSTLGKLSVLWGKSLHLGEHPPGSDLAQPAILNLQSSSSVSSKGLKSTTWKNGYQHTLKEQLMLHLPIKKITTLLLKYLRKTRMWQNWT